jgi:hypothetical protein
VDLQACKQVQLLAALATAAELAGLVLLLLLLLLLRQVLQQRWTPAPAAGREQMRLQYCRPAMHIVMLPQQQTSVMRMQSRTHSHHQQQQQQWPRQHARVLSLRA